MTGPGPVPTPLPAAGPQLRRGLFAGEVLADPVSRAPRRGRLRRWHYVAAGDADTVVGAAVVHLGPVGVAFVFAHVDGRSTTWEVKRPLAAGIRVGAIPAAGAGAAAGDAEVALGGDGSLWLDVPSSSGRLRARITATAASRPAVLATRTPQDGWNVTRKVAGTGVRGEVQLGEGPAIPLAPGAGGWSDWTVGRQDRHTVWRWAAGAGVDDAGRRVGINASTGMNGREVGEDVVWFDGVPYALDVADLAPASVDSAGAWGVRGAGADLSLVPAGVRRADERLGVVTSSYVQPFGAWRGSLLDATGIRCTVTLAGVAEDHLAVW